MQDRESGAESEEVVSETVEQSVERAIEELSKPAEAKPETPEAPQPAESAAPVEAQPAEKAPQQAPATDIEPPARMTAQHKEVFNKLPPEMKAATKKLFDDVNRYFSQGSSELQKALKESHGIAEVIKPKLAEWGLQGHTPQKAVSELVAAHEYIMSKPADALVWLANERGVSLRQLADMQEGKAVAPEAAPVNNDLQQKVELLYNEAQQAKAAQFEQTAQTVVAELVAVRDEKDPAGRYLYPEMHEPGFFERAKPLVKAIQQASGVSWGDALKRAYVSITGKPLQLPAQVQTRVPVTPQEISSAKTAGLSVRGRNGNRPAFKMPDQIPTSIEDTVRLAIEMNSRE
jgi:hypothetical protein